ncbi:hypothetical protein IF1G_06363 [Cordyceps javanica]|uniref:Uncharacterized protein n=1 Tax=Cordyceps javanica TaxID=43265 RepID=A0A545V0Y8_9HYPO|nr:hypothetical protein IF1G_06363 [Cordyceps javanica]TQW02523.1 hypothetical protein IF2G_09914 [Cordyceps javanica]
MSRSSSSPRAVAVTAAPPNPATLISRLFFSFFFLFSLSLCVSPSLAAHAQPAPLPTLAQPQPQPPDDDGHHHHYNVNQRAHQQQPSAPPYTTAPLVTPAPSAAPADEQQRLQDQGFRQETYYTCITAPSGREHCGWHTPLVRQPKHGSGASPVLAVPRPGRRVTDTRLVLAVVAALAGVFVVGLM